jgi:hypothetical protein
MDAEWKEVVRLRFKGSRFLGHALDLTALAELSHFQRMVAETAKALWRAANPDRQRLPPHFEDHTRLCLRRIDDGSAVAPLEVLVQPEEEYLPWETEVTEISDAVSLAQNVFEAVESDAPLPERFPKYLVAEYAKWGQELAQDDEVEIETPDRRRARMTAANRSRLSLLIEKPHEGPVDITGEVLEADVRQRHFQVWTHEDTCARVCFSPEQEDAVTSALKDHRSLRLRVLGRGQFAPSGQLLQVTQVSDLAVIRPGEPRFDQGATAIEDELSAIAAGVPRQEWDNLPKDLTDHLDHYLYGTRRR